MSFDAGDVLQVCNVVNFARYCFREFSSVEPTSINVSVALDGTYIVWVHEYGPIIYLLQVHTIRESPTCFLLSSHNEDFHKVVKRHVWHVEVALDVRVDQCHGHSSIPVVPPIMPGEHGNAFGNLLV